MVLRKSKFYGFCYADDIQEHEFFAKNFTAIVQQNSLEISFEFMRGLDIGVIKSQLQMYSFYEIEDNYLKSQLIEFLKLHNYQKKIVFRVRDYVCSVGKVKFHKKGFVIALNVYDVVKKIARSEYC